MESADKSGSGNITSGEAESNHSRKSSSLSSSSSSSGVVIGLDPEDVIQVGTLGHEEDDNIDAGFRDDSVELFEPHSSDSSPSQASDPSASYRIPPSVFARAKSTAPMEWSVASNESLFSIQMGNTSFTRDHVNWIGKSGELNYPVDSNFSSPMNGPRMETTSGEPPTPSKHSPNYKSGEVRPENAERVGVTETKSAEKKDEKAPCTSPSLSRRSDASGASTKSFAFPILTEEKSTSRHARTTASSQPLTPKVAQQTQEAQAQTQQSKTENGANNKSGFFECKWLSCFPCGQKGSTTS